MPVVDSDEHTELTHVRGKTVAVVSSGNQARAKALNLRDSAAHVIADCLPDSYRQTAIQDGCFAVNIEEGVKGSDIVLPRILDEIQAQVYRESIEPHLRPGVVLCFASGSKIRFGFIIPPRQIDVVMLVPPDAWDGSHAGLGQRNWSTS